MRGEPTRGVELAVRLLVSEPARNIDPLGHAAAQALLCAHERFEIIGLHERFEIIGLHEGCGGMGDIEQANVAEVHGRRRSHEASMG